MKHILISLSLLISGISFAQSNLPACTSTPFSNCFGPWTYDNGEYIGEWLNNKRNGQGTFTFNDGNKYIGQYKDGQRNGKGTFTFASGNKYTGQFKDGYFHGQGTFAFVSGEKHVGEFREDNFNGQGIHTYEDGSKYVGEFRDDKRNGQGTYTYTNGEKYVGYFKDSKKDGYGTLYNADRTIYQQGLWKDGVFVQAQMPPLIEPVNPKPTTSNANDVKRQKCIRLGLVPGSADFQQCIN